MGFAGTEPPSAKNPDGDGRHSAAEKGSDFESRLTLGVIDLTTGSNAHRAAELAELERIYLAVSLLKVEFSEVDHISEAVLCAFRDLASSIKARDVKFFVRRFKDVQYGSVTSRNVPENWPNDRDHAAETAWRDEVKKAHL